MSLPLSAVFLALAWYAALNLTASVIAVAITSRVADVVHADARRARRLLALRLFPPAMAAGLTIGVFLPAHLMFEPPGAQDRFGTIPILLAFTGLLLAARSAWRLTRALSASRSVGRCASSTSERADGVAVADTPLLSGIALAGVVRPRVLVGARARRALTAAELNVAVAHEIAHQRAGDNLARVLLDVTPDVFALTPQAARLERLWSAEAECVADARAAAGSEDRAATLASALIKVARLAAVDVTPRSPHWSTFHHAALLELRVRLLVNRERQPASASRWTPWLAAGAVALSLAWWMDAGAALHALTEVLLARLP